MTPRERFLSAVHQKPVDRPPVWLMRQAGRYLPEYRTPKAKHDFLTMVRTPKLATEVTLQPLRRFPLDAAIIFSDILVIPEALGQGYHFRDQGGIGMDYLIDSPAKIKSTRPFRHVGKTALRSRCGITMTRSKLGEDKALLGFCGSPWTLACYMVEGGSAKDFTVKQLALGWPRNSRHSCKLQARHRRISPHADRCWRRCRPDLRLMGLRLPPRHITKHGPSMGFTTSLRK